jgi:exopolysaccharide biosynthesis polyprenyl glycosylphosphotransferase
MAAPDIAASKLYTETVARFPRERTAGPQTLVQDALAAAEAAADFVLCVSGFVLGHAIVASHALSVFALRPLQSAIAQGVEFGLIVVLLSQRERTYWADAGLLRIRETERVLRVSGQALLLLLAISWLSRGGASLANSLAAALIVPAMLIVEKNILHFVAGRIRRAEHLGRAVIYGSGDACRIVISTLSQSFRLGLRPVAVISDAHSFSSSWIPVMGYRGRGSIPQFSGPVTAARLQSLRCNLLLVASPNLPEERIESAAEAALQIGADIGILRQPHDRDDRWPETLEIDGASFATSRVRPKRWIYESAKRIIDIFAALALMVALAPALIVIAVLIQLDSPGPALFVQRRVGREGVPFEIYKFRSMFVDSPQYARSPVSSNDPRITRVGRVLRRLSLDELPQLINVLKGSMSLVGPRPEMPFVVARYDARHRERLRVTPGITGIWQLSADRAFPIHENIEYDLYYIRNRSFSMDAAIIIHTLMFALCGGI